MTRDATLMIGRTMARAPGRSMRRDARRRAGAEVALGCVVGFAATVSLVAWGWLGAGVSATWVVGLAAARHDLRRARLPDLVTLMAGASALASAIGATVASGWQPAGAAAAGALAVTLPLAWVHLAAPGAMGFGDVKLAAALGLGLGLLDWRVAVLGLATSSVVALASAASHRRSAVPFGPGLVAGAALAGGAAAVGSLVGSPLMGWEIAGWR